MRITGLFAADSASVTNDRLDVKGGLFDGLQTSAWPAKHTFTVVFLLRPEEQEVNVKHHFDVHITAPDGSQVGHSHGDVTLHAFRQQVPVVVEVPATMNASGEYEISVRSSVTTDAFTFQLVGPEDTSVAKAVEGYALGLDKAQR